MTTFWSMNETMAETGKRFILKHNESNPQFNELLPEQHPGITPLMWKDVKVLSSSSPGLDHVEHKYSIYYQTTVRRVFHSQDPWLWWSGPAVWVILFYSPVTIASWSVWPGYSNFSDVIKERKSRV